MSSDPPTQPRDAATVVVMRAAPGGVELFCVERHQGSSFMGGALVFPGGKVDPTDRSPAWDSRVTAPADRAVELGATLDDARAFAVAALRETLEEAAILPVVGDAIDDEALLALRRELSTPSAPSLAALLERRGLVLDAARLQGLSRWVTPVFEPRRFDTRFYLLAAPKNQSGAHDDHETTRSFWATPDEILSRWAAGDVMLAPPTSFTIGLFRGATDLDQAFAIAGRQSLSPVQPHLVNDGDGAVLTLPGDPLFPGAPGPPVLDGATRFVLENGRFVAASANR